MVLTMGTGTLVVCYRGNVPSRKCNHPHLRGSQDFPHGPTLTCPPPEQMPSPPPTNAMSAIIVTITLHHLTIYFVMFPLLYVQRKFKLPLMGFNGGSRELEEGSHVILDTPSSTFVQLGLLFDTSLIFLSILLFDALKKVYTCAYFD